MFFISITGFSRLRKHNSHNVYERFLDGGRLARYHRSVNIQERGGGMFRNAIQRFLYGRYGMDQLGRALLYIGLGLLLVSMLSGSFLVNVVALVLYGLVLARMLSRNYAARRRENERYLRLTAPAARRLRLWRSMLGDKEHRYFKCPGCKKYLRVPRGKGRVAITCRSCGCKFTKES